MTQMKGMVLIFTFLITQLSFAGVATVLEVVPGEEPFVKLSNGEVRFLGEKSLMSLGDEVEVEDQETSIEGGYSLENSSFRPTVLDSESETANIFTHMRGRPRWRSQCYNRAHVWAYEEFQRRGTKLNKTFIFFTNRYIRNYRYKWWFHVAPSAVVKSGDTQVEEILDWSYFDGPTDVQSWTKYFIYSGRSCPVVYKYSDYENHQEAEDCYLIKTSMYFWQPLDIDSYEKTGVEKSSFISSEVNRAYKQAF